MVFQTTPVTGMTLLLSSVSAIYFYQTTVNCASLIVAAASAARREVVERQICTFRWLGDATTPSSLLASMSRMLFYSIPLGPIAFTLQDTVVVTLLLIHLRELEKRWGSGRFLSFLLSASFVGGLYTTWVISSGTPGLSAVLPTDLRRVASCLGSLVVLSALCQRYHHDVPEQTVPKAKMWGLLLKLLVWMAAGSVTPGSYRRQGMPVCPGGWHRLGAVSLGVLFGALSAPRSIESSRRGSSDRGSLLYRWILLFSRTVCRPLCRHLQPLFGLLFGSPDTRRQHRPARHQRPSSSFTGTGRLQVDHLAGGSGGGAGGQREGLLGGDIQLSRAQRTALRRTSNQLEELRLLPLQPGEDLVAMLVSCGWEPEATVAMVLEGRAE